MLNQTLTAAARPTKRTRTNPLTAGLPDPRPVTGYDAVYDEVDGHSRIFIKLDQPCIIRAPAWGFVNVKDGTSIAASSVSVSSATEFAFDFLDIIDPQIAFIDVPYQDPQVQNFQGGFVRPGGQWFREPG